MYHDEMLEQERARPLGPQVWACDCHSEGHFRQIETPDGFCPSCGYYAKKIRLIDIQQMVKLAIYGYTQEDKFIELRRNSMPINLIAKQLGISYGTALRWNKKNNCGNKKVNKDILHKSVKMSLKNKKGRPRDERTEVIINFRKDGYTYANIAIMLNMAESTIASICQREFKLGRFAK